MIPPATNIPNDHPHFKYLVLVATTTREKVDQYRAAARAKGIPVEFRMLTDVEPWFHSAEENAGNGPENAGQKLTEIEKNIAACREPGSESREALERKCGEWGVEFDPRNIYFATDDSTFTVASDIWKRFKEKLRPYVDEDLLESKLPKKAHKKVRDKEPVEEGLGAEFGPIASAVGITRFFNLLRESALEAHYKNRPVGISQHVTMPLHCLDGASEDQPISLEAEKRVFLYTPKGLNTPFEEPAAAITKTEHFLRANGKTVPLSESWARYVVTDHERAEIVEKLCKDVFRYKGEKKQHPHSVPPDRKFALGLPTVANYNQIIQNQRFFHNLDGSGFMLEFPNAAHMGDHVPSAIITKPHEALSQESILSRSDALLFTPFDPAAGDEAQRLAARTENYLALFSARVAKTLIARDMNKPLVIMNYKNCWQDAIDAGLDFVRKGMSKDHLMLEYEPSAVPPTRGVTHLATRYYDVVSGDDLEQLRKAAVKVLDHRRAEYTPFNDKTRDHQDKFLSGGSHPLPPKDMFRVAVFVSAQNDNRRLLTDMRELGCDLAAQEFGLIWGGGDRHGMGAVYDGYRDFKKANPHANTWMAAFSTKPILKSETKHGKMPEEGVDYWERNSDIYQRMAHMIHKNDAINSDAIVVAPGGDGTFQEWLAVLHMKHQFPAIMKGKSLIIYTPDLHRSGGSENHEHPFWEKGIKAVMGDEFYKNIMGNHHVYGNSQGIYLATDETELMQLLADLRRKGEIPHVARLAREQPGRDGPQLWN